MKLYKRDYSQLTDEERAEWQTLQAQEVVGELGGHKIRQSRFPDYPRAARHYISLFPNNYLDIIELREEQRLNLLLENFRVLLNDASVSERKLLNFINKTGAHFIIGSILASHYNFGHHGAFLFPEFPLGTSFKADYMLAGESSDGWSFLFVELESPTEHITLKNGELGTSFRKGLIQIADWDTWIDANFSSLRETFDKSRRRCCTNRGYGWGKARLSF